MEPLAELFQTSSAPAVPLPAELERLYGGRFPLEDDVVYANSVSTIDGVASIPSAPRSSAVISGGGDGDRFVMGLLRACADVVLIGAGTLRTHTMSHWTAQNAYPPAAQAFAQLRMALGHSTEAPVAVVTASGHIDPDHPGLQRGGVVLTTKHGLRMMRLPARVQAVDLGERSQPDGRKIIDALRELGFRRILTEGGPSLMGSLMEAVLVDELFLTLSPTIAGRSGKEQRPGIVDGFVLLPDRRLDLSLRSIHRSDAYLMLRYDVAR